MTAQTTNETSREVRTAYLSIERDNLNLDVTFTSGPKAIWAGTNIDDLRAFCAGLGIYNFMCSSDIDFPEECTTSQDVINACHIIRGRKPGPEPKATEVRTGDLVRSFDFAETTANGTRYGFDLDGDRACYVIGIVEGTERMFGANRYRIRVITQIFGGQVVADPEPYVFPPVNGTLRMSGAFNGVEKA